jgi:hypothetical protein
MFPEAHAIVQITPARRSCPIFSSTLGQRQDTVTQVRLMAEIENVQSVRELQRCSSKTYGWGRGEEGP